MVRERPITGLVLSGGGARGAYQVGVLSGIGDILKRRPEDPPPFRIFAGASVGGLNCTFLAAHADRGDMEVARLARAWTSLRLGRFVRIGPVRLPWRSWPPLDRQTPAWLGRSLLDPRPLIRVVRDMLPAARLHDNVRNGTVRALMVPALDLFDGRTTIFAQVAPGVPVEPALYPPRRTIFTRIAAEHIVASGSLPLLYPARRLDGRYYVDGGLRFNAPIASAVRAGADRLVVVELLQREWAAAEPLRPLQRAYPGIPFLLGKLLNTLLLDPVAYDLQTLKRFNVLFDVLDDVLEDEAQQRAAQALKRAPGIPHSELPTLAINPSEDIGALAAHYVRRELPERHLPVLTWLLFRLLRRSEAAQEADLSSYLLFDGGFARRLIELGRRDAFEIADDIRHFFS